VTDDGGLTDTTTTTAAITEVPNEPPVADPNGPYPGTAGQPVLFDGSGSSDPDGTIVSYAWDFGDSGTGTGVSPTHTYAAAGTYTVSLTVTDDGGLTDTATTTATIEPAVQLVDLDITRFSVRKSVKLRNGQSVTIEMTVANNGTVDEPRPATVVGTQNGDEVYNVTIQVSSTPGRGGSQFSFPDYTPTETGDITWVATIADDDPDIDEATATTTVK
jgi:PKD repeat protein